MKPSFRRIVVLGVTISVFGLAGYLFLYWQARRAGARFLDATETLLQHVGDWDADVGEPLSPVGLVIMDGDTIAELKQRIRMKGVSGDSVTVLSGRWYAGRADSGFEDIAAALTRVDTGVAGELRVSLDSTSSRPFADQRSLGLILYLSRGVTAARMVELFAGRH